MEKIIVDVNKVAPNDVILSFGCFQASFSFVRGELKMTSKTNLFNDRGDVYLPKNIFAAMTRRAAQILKDQQAKQYQWFVEPLDAATNEAIYNGLRAKNFSSADEMRRILDSDDVYHMVWEADYPFISFVEKSAKSRALKFRIFNRSGENAKARPWPFPRRRKTFKKTAAKKAAA